MTQTHLDTHVFIWLYEGNIKHFGKVARRCLSSDVLYYSPLVVLELQYLFENSKLTVFPEEIIEKVVKDVPMKRLQNSFVNVCAAAESLSWTRDLFDRLIVAEASLNHAKLITNDTKIHEHYKKAVW